MATMLLTLESVACALNGGVITVLVESDAENTRVHLVSNPPRYQDIMGAGYVTFTGVPNGTYTLFARDKADFQSVSPNLDGVSVDCEVRPVCDLAITAVQTTRAAGIYGTGTVTGTASSASPYLRWSVDNENWQQSNTLDATAGAGTLYVRDENPLYKAEYWCTASTNYVIGVNETYGPRYVLDFDDVQSRPLGLAIQNRNYEGTPEPICGGGGPVSIQYADQGIDKYALLVESKATLSLLADTSSKYLAFFSEDEREHRVDVTYKGLLFWRGFILPDVYNEPFIAPTYEVQVWASDGLGTLKHYAYTDPNGNPFTGERSLLDVVFDCLDRLDLDLPFISMVDVYEASMFETEDLQDPSPIISDPLSQAVVDTESFLDEKGTPLDCEKVLTRCLEHFGARIYQDRGHWKVECIDAKRGPVWATTYSPDRAFVSYALVNPILDIVPPTADGLIWIGGDQQREIVPAYKKTVVRSELQIKENIIPGGDLRPVDFTESGLLKGWTATDPSGAPVPYVRGVEGKERQYVSFQGPTPIDEQAANRWVSPVFRLEYEEATQLYLKLSYKATVVPDTLGDPILFFQLTDGENTYTNTGWKSTGGYAAKVLEQPAKDVVELLLPGVPVGGDYRLVVYEASNNVNLEDFRLYGASLQVLPQGVYPYLENTSTITNPKRYSYSPEVKEVYFTDTQATANFRQVHGNYLAVNGQQSQGWHIKGQGGSNNLANLLAANIAYNYSRPSHLLRGTLMGEVSYSHTLREPQDGNRLFLWGGLTLDLRAATATGTLLELVTPLGPRVYRVLEARGKRKLENGAFRTLERL